MPEVLRPYMGNKEFLPFTKELKRNIKEKK